MPIPLRRIVATVIKARTDAPTGRLPHRVWPSYVDLNLHMNHASYLEVMELGRWHWMAERGFLFSVLRAGMRPIVVHEEVTYKRELKPLQRFDIVTHLVRREGKVATFRHRLVVGDTLHAEGHCRFLMVKKRAVLDGDAVGELLDRFVEPG